MSDFQVTSTLKARKQHHCCECAGTILPGQQYQRVSGVWEGNAEAFKTCLPCVEARDWATKQPEWGGDGEHLFYFEMLSDDLSNLAPEIAPGDGRRFRVLRLQCQMAARRKAAADQRQVAS